MILKNTSRISLGTIIRIWHNTRGHDYVVVGISPTDRKIALIKHNCINNDGTIHSSTASSYLAHKVLAYDMFGRVYGVSSVIGTCTRLNKTHLSQHFANSSFTPDFPRPTKVLPFFYCYPNVDRRSSTYY